MATFLTDKCTEIRNWLAIGADVYSDQVVTGWIRMAEEYLSVALRVKHMVQIDTSNIINGRVPMPLDWQEIRLVRRLDTGGVCRYQTPDAFYNPEFPNSPSYPTGTGQKCDTQLNRYTILGNFLIVGDAPSSSNPVTVEMTYYQNIPPLADNANNWPNVYHPTVYTLKILHVASMYSIEDARSQVWDQEVVRMVNGMNAQHKIDMASGSVLMPVRRKTFG
jgi:hypothetical protein